MQHTINQDIERRFLKNNITLRSVDNQDNKFQFEGYAIVFDSPSLLMYDWNKGKNYTEYIAPGAITPDLISKSDIKFLFNHNENNILGIHNQDTKTFDLTINNKGLFFKTNTLPNTSLVKDLYELMNMNIINKCSFSFTYIEDSWKEDNDGNLIRTFTKLDKLYDISIVTYPAYPDTLTNISERSQNSIKNYLDNKKFEFDKNEKEKLIYNKYQRKLQLLNQL